MYTLDANIFVRDADPRDPEHQACHTLLDGLRDSGVPLALPALVLAEVAGAVSRSQRDPIRGRLMATLVRSLPTHTLVPVDEVIAQEAADLAADYGLRGADAIYVAVARRNGSVLVSLDREVRERAATVVTVLTPAEALARLMSA